MRTFAIVNMKGGVGKTTTAINLAYLLATEYQLRVLLVDADGQRNATRTLLPSREYDGLAALLEGMANCYDEVIEPTDIDNLDMIPASAALWSVDLKCAMGEGRDAAFRALRDVRDNVMEDSSYDVMVIDCPPHFSASCISAIAAANAIIVPVVPDAYSAEGMKDLVEQIDGVRKIHPTVRVAGCLVTHWHNADVVADATEYLREASPVPVYQSVIRRTDKVLESTWAKEPVLVWSPQSSAARDYRAWVRELVTKEGMLHGKEV